jgi:phosphatidylglycerophosphate synthase
MSRGALLTLPNMVSVTRLVFAPIFFMVPRVEARVALVLAAAASDMLDGWLARRQLRASRIGALIDPVADRVFVLTAVLTMVLEGALSVGQVAVLLSRDIMTTIGFFVARRVSWLRPEEFRARMPGKVVTVLQVITLLAALVLPARVGLLVAITGLVSLVAVTDYTLVLWRERAR